MSYVLRCCRCNAILDEEDDNICTECLRKEEDMRVGRKFKLNTAAHSKPHKGARRNTIRDR